MSPAELGGFGGKQSVVVRSYPERQLPFEGSFVFGFRLFAWVGAACVFSTPEHGGSLKSQGGWILFIMDTCDVWMFGNWWQAAWPDCMAPSDPEPA